MLPFSSLPSRRVTRQKISTRPKKEKETVNVSYNTSRKTESADLTCCFALPPLVTLRPTLSATFPEMSLVALIINTHNQTPAMGFLCLDWLKHFAHLFTAFCPLQIWFGFASLQWIEVLICILFTSRMLPRLNNTINTVNETLTLKRKKNSYMWPKGLFSDKDTVCD